MRTICGARALCGLRPIAAPVGDWRDLCRGEGAAGGESDHVDVLAPTIIGEEALAIQRLWRKLVDATHWTQNGIGMGVISGIEMALWDLKGKHLGVPVYELLGGLAQPIGAAVREHVPRLLAAAGLSATR